MRRLRRLLRRWLIEDERAAEPVTVSTELIVQDPMTQRRLKVAAQQLAGNQLLCTAADGSCRLVAAQHAEDEVHFWKLWKQLGGGQACWADGTPYDPST